MSYLLRFGLLFLVSFNSLASELNITDVWVAEAPPVSRVHAGYFKLENLTTNSITLTGVTSKAYRAIEIHKSIESNGTASMQHLESVTLAAGESLQFKPGGYHLMLFGPAQRWQQGDSFEFTFDFSGDKRLTRKVVVKKMLATEHHHHHDHH